ncbi:hypothetical protein D3C78_1796840 [compost metagenome]
MSARHKNKKTPLSVVIHNIIASVKKLKDVMELTASMLLLLSCAINILESVREFVLIRFCIMSDKSVRAR